MLRKGLKVKMKCLWELVKGFEAAVTQTEERGRKLILAAVLFID